MRSRRRQDSRRQGAIAIGLALVLGACASAEPEPLAGLTPFGGTWHVLSIDDQVIDEEVRAPALQFQVRGALSVTTRCGMYELKVTSVSDTTLSFGEPSRNESEDGCDDRDMVIDATLRSVLEGVETFSDGRPGDRLTLLGRNGQVLLAQPAANPTFCSDC